MAKGSPSKVEWTAWGERDPLWGAATWKGHGHGGPRAWTDEDFYETGRLDWEVFTRRWRAYGLDSASCVEIACGAGRITKQLVSTFDHVVALDVSPGMIAYAKQRVAADNVTFHVTDGRSIPLEDGSVMAAFSSHAFHNFNSVEDGARYFEECARVLAEGGTLMINLDVHEYPVPGNLLGMHGSFVNLQKGLYSGAMKLTAVLAAFRRWRLRDGTSGGRLFMRSLSYEISGTFLALDRLGFTDIELSIFPVPTPPFQSERDQFLMRLHTFVFARKSTRSPS